MRSHNFESVATTIRCPGHAELAARVHRNGNGRRISDSPALHREDYCLHVIHFVRPAESDEAVRIAESTHGWRNHHVTGAREIVRHRHDRAARLRSTPSMDKD